MTGTESRSRPARPRLPPMPAGAPMNRLGLAEWIVDPKNPLTARVWVNRAWERFFGVGIVKTSENLGVQADPPSNQDLLDWLASEFVHPTVETSSGEAESRTWDMKALQKTIVMSATYRQSSTITPQLEEQDPENRLLARGPRFRLQAEMVRDNALAVAGLLVDKLGGDPVRPTSPTASGTSLPSTATCATISTTRATGCTAEVSTRSGSAPRAAADDDLRYAQPRDLCRQTLADQYPLQGFRAAQ